MRMPTWPVFRDSMCSENIAEFFRGIQPFLVQEYHRCFSLNFAKRFRTIIINNAFDNLSGRIYLLLSSCLGFYLCEYISFQSCIMMIILERYAMQRRI